MTTPKATVVTYFEKLNGSDAAGLAALFTDDGAFMGNGVPTASGRDDIRTFAAGAFRAATHTHEYEVDRVEEADQLAVVQTHSSATVRPADGGEPSYSSHRSMFVLRRTGDGWRIAQYMYNSV